MRQALGSVAWSVSLALLVASCMPPETQVVERPSPRPSTAQAAQPAPPVVPPQAVFLYSPQRRTAFVAGERAEFTLALCVAAEIPNTTVALTLQGAERKWTATDSLGTLGVGRHSVSYGIDVGLFPPGDYKLTADVGGKLASGAFTVVSPVRKTRFRIAAWVEKPPRDERDARRWSDALGLNTILVQDRSPWQRMGTLDASYGPARDKLMAAKVAEPLEVGTPDTPFVHTADLLTKAGLQWVNCCAVSGGGQPPLRPERSFADPAVVRGARQRIHHRLLAERQFAACAGIHFSSETSLAWHQTTGYEGPFGHPARLAGFQQRTEAEGFDWRQGAKNGELWRRFMRYRAGVVGEALGSWAQAVAAIEPEWIATSQVYTPLALGEGAYPPLQGQGLPLLCTQAGLNGPAGMMMPMIAADLQRAGQWGKPLWFMPELADDAELDEARASLILALARKLDGVVYPPNLDYHLDRPAAGPLPTQLLEGISGINTTLARLGDFFLALEKPRHDIAILYSVTEHMARIGKDPVEDPHGTAYPWTVLSAYISCMFAHFPPTLLTEEELLAGEAARCKAILLVALTEIEPAVKARLEAFIGAGGIVLADQNCTVEIEGAKELPIRFPDLNAYHEELWKKGEEENVDTTLERRDEVAQAKLLYDHLADLRSGFYALKTYNEETKEFDRILQRDFTVNDRNVLICDQTCGAGRYLFIVNNKQRTDIFRGLKWELTPVRTRVTLRRANYNAYDVVGGARIILPRVQRRPVIDLVLPAGGLDCIALLPEVIRGVALGGPRLRDGRLELKGHVHGDDDDEPIDAAIPIEVRILDPDGRPLYHVYRAHTPAGYQEAFPFPPFAEPGEWKIEVRELLSRYEATARFTVAAPGPARWVSRRGKAAVFDGVRITALLTSAEPLWILVGTEAEAQQAEALAQTLRVGGREVEVRLASTVAAPRKLDAKAAKTYVSAAPGNAPMPDIRQPAILLGDVASHPLLHAVHNAGLLPRAVTPDYTGRGGALLCWLASAFEPDVPAVVAAANDPAGVDLAVATLRAAVGAPPRTASRALPGATAPLPPSEPPPGQELEPRWASRLLDNPVAAVAPPRSERVIVGLFHGAVSAYDVIGKPQWTSWCRSRCRDVAASFDGSWIAAASFPEVALITSRGTKQWEFPLEGTAPRASFTAVATALNSALTVAGSRRGTVVGLDLEGRRIFATGAVEGEEGAATQAPRFGAVGAIAIAPQLDFVIVGGELVTAALEPTGQELWRAEELRRVTSLAVSLEETPSIAVGTRDGVVACLSKDGTARWRTPVEGYVTSVCFLGTSQHLLAASLGGTVTCFDDQGKVLWRHESPVGFRHVATSLDGETIAVAELAGRALLLDPAGVVLARTPRLEGIIRVMTLSAEGSRLLVGTSANRLHFFRYARPKAQEDVL